MNFDPTTAITMLALFGGIVGAFVAFFKAPREANNISVTAAEGAVKVQVLLNEEMQKTLDRLRRDVDGLRDELGSVRRDLANVTLERDELRRERDELRARVVHLEQRVEDLGRESRGERREREDAETADEQDPSA